jgi:dolichol-phosphate mannosyltransferase
MLSVSVIIPTYNEAKNLQPLVEEIYNFIDKTQINLEIIFVDDNSPDQTGKIAEELSNKYPVKVIHRAGKLGLGSAVREGFAVATRPILGVMDADLSHDPAILNNLIKSLNDYDIAVGSRFEIGSSVEDWQFGRKLLSEIGVALARKLTNTRDPLSGYFFINRPVIGGINLETTGYKILLEILVKGKFNKVIEIPFNFRMRKFSVSKLNYREYFLFIKQLVEYVWFKIGKA